MLEGETAVANRVPRLRFPVLCVLIFWVASFVVGAFDKPYFFGFLYEIASSSLVTLCFLVWWWFNRRLRYSEKFLGFALMAGEAWVVGRLSHHSINYFTLWLAGFPLVVTIVVAWLCLVKRFGISWARIGFLAVVRTGSAPGVLGNRRIGFARRGLEGPQGDRPFPGPGRQDLEPPRCPK